MKCKYCGSQMPDGDRVCTYCGEINEPSKEVSSEPAYSSTHGAFGRGIGSASASGSEMISEVDKESSEWASSEASEDKQSDFTLPVEPEDLNITEKKSSGNKKRKLFLSLEITIWIILLCGLAFHGTQYILYKKGVPLKWQEMVAYVKNSVFTDGKKQKTEKIEKKKIQVESTENLFEDCDRGALFVDEELIYGPVKVALPNWILSSRFSDKVTADFLESGDGRSYISVSKTLEDASIETSDEQSILDSYIEEDSDWEYKIVSFEKKTLGVFPMIDYTLVMKPEQGIGRYVREIMVLNSDTEATEVARIVLFSVEKNSFKEASEYLNEIVANKERMRAVDDKDDGVQTIHSVSSDEIEEIKDIEEESEGSADSSGNPQTKTTDRSDLGKDQKKESSAKSEDGKSTVDNQNKDASDKKDVNEKDAAKSDEKKEAGDDIDPDTKEKAKPQGDRYIATGYLNLRDKPSGKVVGTIDEDTIFYVSKRSGDWLQVQISDSILGWVYSDGVEKIDKIIEWYGWQNAYYS